MMPFRIRVPASSANLGPGFDSMGLALNLYLTIEAEPADTWRIEQHSAHLPDAENPDDHYILRVAQQTAERWGKKLTPCQIQIWSDIPLARGLGSSASAIVAGIELANQMCSLALTDEEKLKEGTAIEGHPDNIAPAVMGGWTISAVTDQGIEWLSVLVSGLGVVVSVPDIELETEAARRALPDTYTRKHAASASAVSNVLIAALMSGDYQLLGRMMEQDLFHEPYRERLIPHYRDIRRFAKNLGAYGTVLSGAGPTMISFIPAENSSTITDHLKQLLPDDDIKRLDIDHQGVTTQELT